MRYFLLIILTLLTIFESCYYDNEEDLYPVFQQSCDTTNVSFENSIKPILEVNCFACHSNANAAAFGNNLAIENYQDVVNLQQPIIGAIKHEPPYSPMPKSGNKLSDCLIRQFEIWIENDFPQN
jgi:hypothetical protein